MSDTTDPTSTTDPASTTGTTGATTGEPGPLTYGLVVFDGAEELDFVGPWEVFTASAMVRATGDQCFLIGEHDRPVRCAKSMSVLPHHTFDDHPPLDVVLVPGGMGTLTEVDNPRLIEWLVRQAETARWMTSVCTGSLLLWASGVAKDRRVATHWVFEDELERRGATVVRDARWVRDGNVVTSQGVSAGIDMALWLIGEEHSPAHARMVQHDMQYAPAPPYAADV